MALLFPVAGHSTRAVDLSSRGNVKPKAVRCGAEVMRLEKMQNFIRPWTQEGGVVSV